MEYSNIIKRIRAFANSHYESGWDVIAEAYTDYELLEIFKRDNVTSYKEAKKSCLDIINFLAECESNSGDW